MNLSKEIETDSQTWRIDLWLLGWGEWGLGGSCWGEGGERDRLEF